ncbi:MAG: beta galactosidase jelly roll domain-containing protein [Opitutae bacterium]|nr:beta galactosidase jelly roll domain-containing protein [Opitutae bacterium]
MNSLLKTIPVRSFVLGLAAAAGIARADVVPASLFCDHAVLQQGMPIPVWGDADEGEKVTVTLAGQTVSTVARGGRWSVRLAALPAGGPHTLTIEGKNRIALSDVLVGEVWVCSGQSNMERQLGPRPGQKPIKDWETEAATANLPQIRHFGVAQHLALTPQARVGGQWLVCTPQTAPEFTAVGFFFGRALHLARGTPIGLIHSSWGGTPAEAWTSREGMAQVPGYAGAVARFDRVRHDPEGARAEFERDLARWFEVNDPGSAAHPAWSAETLDASAWSAMRLPAFWEGKSLPQDFDGLVWFRREVEIPAAWSGHDVELHLGAIDDVDATWVNGHFVGSTKEWTAPRVYRLPAGTLKTGRNVIAVRVLDTGGGGGLWGGSDTMRLARVDDPAQTIAVDGEWRYRVAVNAHNAPPAPLDPSISSGTPTVLYNGMIAPLVPYAIRGAIWYQGEANAGQAQLYRELFPRMVADWRRVWGQGNFPFLYVQIAPFRGMPPEIREAQRLSLAKIPNSAMVVTIDVGDANDIHPANKKPVGERLALAARALVHGEKLEHSGPLFASLQIAGPRAVLKFTHLGGGLVAKDGELKGFTVAGADKVFHPARAKIVGEGNTVEVSSDAVAAPVTVRYGWADVPAGNLFNRAGLPASPFATDFEH